MWEITKSIDLAYGHRVHNQELKSQFANDLKCACRHLHGHQGKVDITLQGDTLENGMVTDFRHLEWLKKTLDEFCDHQFIMDIKDPLLPTFLPDTEALECKYIYHDESMCLIGTVPKLPEDSELHINELLEGLFIVDFVPTSENLAKWVFDMTQWKMNFIDVKVKSVTWWETPKSRSIYVG